jgi:hypothetical protein
MTTALKTQRLLALAAIAWATSVSAAEAGDAKSEAKTAAAAAAKDAAKKSAATGVADMIRQLGAQRDTMIADHEALARQLKDATDAQKKAIMEKMEERKRAYEEAASALHRQIVEERRRERQGAAPRR